MGHQRYKAILAVLLFVSPASGTVLAQPSRLPAELARQVIRSASFDICFPATSEEYEALGKHAILEISASTAISAELPIRSVYLVVSGVRVSLHRIAASPRSNLASEGRVSQRFYYLLPIQMMKRDAQVLTDFSGERKGFGITSFRKADGLDGDAPMFARLDEYDAPSDPDMSAVLRVLAREYDGPFNQ